MSRTSKLNQIEMTKYAVKEATKWLPKNRREDAELYLRLLLPGLKEHEMRLVESLIDVAFDGGVTAQQLGEVRK